MANSFSYKILNRTKFNQLKSKLHSLETEISEALAFVNHLDEDGSEKVIDKNKDSELIQALGELRSKLKESSERDRRSKWVTEGLNKFIDILKSDGNVQALYDKLIASTVRYVKANQGGIYILNQEDEDNPFLELRSCYAYERKKFLEKKIKPGEGLAGQCVFEKDMIFLTDIPRDYVKITSGLGMATPRNVIVLPLIYNENVLGVLELASFNVLQDYEVEFLKKLAENIGFSINDLNNAEHTKKLLEQSESNATQMKEQEEMMIQSMEELQATQEEMARNQKYLKASQQRNQVYFEHANYGIVAFNNDGVIDDANQQALSIFESSIEDIRGMNINNLLVGFKTENVDRFINNKKRVQIVKKDGKKLKIEITINHAEVDDKEFYVAYVNGDISGDLKKEKELARSLMEMDEQKRFMKIKQHELENSQRLSHAFFENSNDSIMTFTDDGDIMEINIAASKLFGLNKDEAYEQNIKNLIPQLDLNRLDKFLNLRNQLTIQSGSKKEVRIELFLIQETVDEMTIYIAYIRDISVGAVKKELDIVE